MTPLFIQLKTIPGLQSGPLCPYARPYLTLLQDQGHRPKTVREHLCLIASLNCRYRQFLLDERGYVEGTVEHYARHAGRFLAGRFGAGRVGLATLRACEITEFVQCSARDHNLPKTQKVVTALRSFPRCLHYCGRLPRNLSSAVPAVAHWRLTGLPKHLPAEAVQRVLDSCEQSSAVGRRNHAILFVRYLKKGRPCCACRKVFVRAAAPHAPLCGSPVISRIVREAIEKAGVTAPRTGKMPISA